MAEQLQFELVSPERQLMSALVHMVVVPGTEGEFGVLAGHAPFMSTVKPGMLHVYDAAGGTPKRIFVGGGFAEVNGKGLTVLTEQAVPAEDIDRDALAQQLKNAEEDLADASTDEARIRAQDAVTGLKTVIESL